MQSGITASPELRAAFDRLASDTSLRFLLAGIEGETVVPLGEAIRATSDGFGADLSLLAPHLTTTRALYVLLRRDDDGNGNGGGGGLVAVTYVPDAAPVRQKTLTASTQLSLLRQLGGSDRFVDRLFATAPADVTTPAAWARHDAHVASAPPLSRDERGLEAVRAAEALERGGTAARRAHTAGHLSMAVQDGVVETLRRLPETDANLVQLDIDVASETVRLVSSSTIASAAELAASIALDAPRYAFYRHDAAADASRPVLFIYTCPPTSKVKERMVYAASRGFVIHLAEADAGIEISKKLEFGSPQDIGQDSIDDEFTPSQETKTAFSRPKRPGRR